MNASDERKICVPEVPMRIVPLSPASPELPIAMLLLLVVMFMPAPTPSATLLLPVDRTARCSDRDIVRTRGGVEQRNQPTAVLDAPLERLVSVLRPRQYCSVRSR